MPSRHGLKSSTLLLSDHHRTLRAPTAVLVGALLASTPAYAQHPPVVPPSAPDKADNGAPPPYYQSAPSVPGEAPPAAATTAPTSPVAPATGPGGPPPAYPPGAPAANPWGTGAGAPAYPPQPGYPAYPGFYPGPGGVYVELRTDNPNTRIERMFGGAATTIACFAPCRKVLPRDGLYVIRGDGVRSTSQFILPDDRPQVTLDVQAGSSGRVTMGVALMVVGGIVGYIGMISWSIGNNGTYYEDRQERASSQRNAGLAMMGIGIPALLIGAYLAMTTHTRVTSSTGVTFTESPTPRPAKKTSIALTARGLEF